MAGGAQREFGRLKPLDGLRAAAVMLVFLHHSFVNRWPGGFLGVDIFFTISGYIITAMLLREWDRTGDLWLRGFYCRRILRLMPALAVVVVVVTPVAYALGRSDSFKSGAAAITYSMDVYAPASRYSGGPFAHTWSLAVEEQFYVVWPWLLLTFLRRGSRGVVALIVAGSAIASAVVVGIAAHEAPNRVGDIYQTPFPHLPAISVGVLLALALSIEPGRRRLSFLGRTWVPLCCGAALLVAALDVHELDGWLYEGGFVIAAVACAAVVGHLVVAPHSAVSRCFGARPAVSLGARSYGFYLWHYPVLLLSADHLHNSLEHSAVGFVATLALTELSWRFVEQPFLRLKGRFSFEARREEDVGVAGVPHANR